MMNDIPKAPQKVDCEDVYSAEIDQSIKTLKNFREAWLRSSSSWDFELFQYADSDYYFYHFAIDRQEKNTESFLTNILYKVMARYGIPFEVPTDPQNAPFIFIICGKEERIGYRFEQFYYGENVNEILQTYNVKKAVILRTWKSGHPDEWILSENEQYKRDGLKQEAISLKSFFLKYFCEEEYDSFLTYLSRYLQEARDILGYKSIKFLSSMNLATQKIFEEKELMSWDYRNYQFQIIDNRNSKILDYLYLSTTSFPASILQAMENNYLSDKLFKAMLGGGEYAESFITSEWLYHSLKGKKNFDYTSVISGYLKSIEQLLYKIVMLNVDNNCKISMSSASEVITAAISNHIITYKPSRRNSWKVVNANDKGFKYIDLTSTQIQYMDSSIGTFEHFLRKNPHIFINPIYSKTIADMVCCFRIECRNGYFHTHNLKKWDVVEKTRSNAIYLYYVLLGGCIIDDMKVKKLGALSSDEFDVLCMKIREFRHYNLKFYFEYDNDKKLSLIYAPVDNTIEFNDEGIEHYESLLFYDVGDFSGEDIYKKLAAGISEDQKVYLTRDNLPKRIFGIHHDGRLEEITY